MLSCTITIVQFNDFLIHKCSGYRMLFRTSTSTCVYPTLYCICMCAIESVDGSPI